MAFTGFYWVSGGVPRLFLEFGESGVVLADFDWTKSVFTGSLGFTRFHRVLFCSILDLISGFYWVCAGFNGLSRVTLGRYGVCLGFIGFYWVFLGL